MYCNGLSLCTKARNRYQRQNTEIVNNSKKSFQYKNRITWISYKANTSSDWPQNINKYQINREICPQTSMSSFPDLPHSSCLLHANWLRLYFLVPVNNGPRSSLVLYRHETKNDRSPTIGFIYLPVCFCPR